MPLKIGPENNQFPIGREMDIGFQAINVVFHFHMFFSNHSSSSSDLLFIQKGAAANHRTMPMLISQKWVCRGRIPLRTRIDGRIVITNPVNDIVINNFFMPVLLF